MGLSLEQPRGSSSDVFVLGEERREEEQSPGKGGGPGMMFTLPTCSVPSAQGWGALAVLPAQGCAGVREVRAGQVAGGELPCQSRAAEVEEVKVGHDAGLSRSSVLHTQAVVSLNTPPQPSAGCWVIVDNNAGSLE